MFEHKPQEGRRRTMSGCLGIVPRWLSRTTLTVSVNRILVSALVFGAMILPVLAQTSPSSTAVPQTPAVPPAPQTSLMPEQESPSTVVVPPATTVPPEYQVGVGDQLGITVYNMPEFGRTIVVGSEGTVVLSYLPRPVAAIGKTAQQIGEGVAAELKQIQVLIDPQVSVSVVSVQSKPVMVGGSVRNPQVLQEVRPFTLQQVLMLAGGPQSGSGNSVLVTRSISNGEMVSYDLQLSKVLAGTDPKANIPIKPGDTIQVLPDQRVFVAGDVKSPGAFPLVRGQQLTVSRLMALTGGWKSDAKPGKAVIVREGSNGQRQTVPVDLPKIMARKQPDVTLEANDLVYVPDSTGKKVGLAAARASGLAVAAGAGYMIIRH
jgi:polysaccharide biosynthesis/export protein